LSLVIRLLAPSDAQAYAEHLRLNHINSGSDGTPIYTVRSRTQPVDVDARAAACQLEWETPISVQGWERAWGAFASDARGGSIVVGAVTLGTVRLHQSQMHRALLAMGIQKEYRGVGLGKRLMLEALNWAKCQPGIEWIDLGVFAHNAPARALYRRFGFCEIGRVVDCFRVDGHSVDDIVMTLALRDWDPIPRG